MNATQGVFFYIRWHVALAANNNSHFVLLHVPDCDMKLVEDALTFM